MKKFAFFLIVFLLILFLCVFISLKNEDDEDDTKLDVTDTGFEYDVAICDKYFELVECIIDRDTNKNWSREMRLEFKNDVKKIQEQWRQLTEQELAKNCEEALKDFENGLNKENLDSFGCLTEVN